MNTTEATNAPAAIAYAAYITTLRSSLCNESALNDARANLASVIADQAASGKPGTGYEVQCVNRDGTLAFTKSGIPITPNGMKPGTPFAIITQRIEGKRRRHEMCKVWPCGTLDSAGPACFTA